MAQRPLVLVAMKSRAELSLLRFYFSSSAANTVVLSPADAALETEQPQLVIGELEPGESAHAASARLRRLHAKASLVLLIDEAGPAAARPGASAHEFEAVLVRPLTMERLDAVLGPRLRDRTMPERPRVLVVDEDPLVLRFIEETLAKAGCAVNAVDNAQRYLSRSLEAEFDLALLDVAIPEVDGLQLCLRLRASRRELVRLCVMSAASDPEGERKSDLYGADEFLAKPLHARVLLELTGRARAGGNSLLRGGRRLRAVDPAGVEVDSPR
jgi:DNA-binding response OmpR family regulator